METKRFSEVDGSEKVVLTYEFAQGLSVGETLLTPTAVVVAYGPDSSPGAIVGAMSVSGTKVLVPISGQAEGVDYHITVTCTTSNATKTLALGAILPCREL